MWQLLADCVLVYRSGPQCSFVTTSALHGRGCTNTGEGGLGPGVAMPCMQKLIRSMFALHGSSRKGVHSQLGRLTGARCRTRWRCLACKCSSQAQWILLEGGALTLGKVDLAQGPHRAASAAPREWPAQTTSVTSPAATPESASQLARMLELGLLALVTVWKAARKPSCTCDDRTHLHRVRSSTIIYQQAVFTCRPDRACHWQAAITLTTTSHLNKF